MRRGRAATIRAACILAPMAIMEEGYKLSVFDDLDTNRVALQVALSGLFHYLNNEVMYRCLARVNPVTLAVGNCVKIKILRSPARRRGDAGSSPLDRARMAASSPRNDLVKNCRCTRRTG